MLHSVEHRLPPSYLVPTSVKLLSGGRLSRNFDRISNVEPQLPTSTLVSQVVLMHTFSTIWQIDTARVKSSTQNLPGQVGVAVRGS